MKRLAILGLALLLFAGLALTHRRWRNSSGGQIIRLDLREDCEVSIGIRDGSGTLVCQLVTSEPMKRGRHLISWDGRGSSGQKLAPGSYRWVGFAHQPFETTMRGWAGLNGTPQWPPAGSGNPWGQFGGTPTAVAADHSARVYLGWSGGAVVAADLDGHAVWSETLPAGRHVQALAVDGPDGFVLSRDDAGADEIVKFDTNRGFVSWGGKEPRRDHAGLRILDLWPADDPTLPAGADGIAVRAGRIYLTFAGAQFIAVLDTESGAYLQTIVGGAPECIAVTATKAEVEEGGGLVPADFAVVSLRGGGLAKVLLAHDPLWVITSTIQPTDPQELITALTIVGDGAPLHPHSLFLGVQNPVAQVQRREILASEGYVWSAGQSWLPPYTGPWEPHHLAQVRGLALDSRGRLWVAEGNSVPSRFSVWNTEGKEGRLEHEYFGPIAPADTAAAVLPSDPAIVVGGGCEWRIDERGGPAECLGIITRDGMTEAQFRIGPSGETLLEVGHLGRFGPETGIFERCGAGNYLLRKEQLTPRKPEATAPLKKLTVGATGVEVVIRDTGESWTVSTSDQFAIGSFFGPPGPDRSGPGLRRTPSVNSLTLAADGHYYAAAGHQAVIRFELIGLPSIRELPGGTLEVRAAAR